MRIWLLSDRAGLSRAHDEGRDFTAHYAQEVLRHAGLSFDLVDLAEIETWSERAGADLLIAPGQSRFAEGAHDALGRWVAAGGTLLIVGPGSGLEPLVGAAVDGVLAEGYVGLNPGASPIRHGFGEALHAFGVAKVRADGEAACGYGTVFDAAHERTPYVPLVVRETGRGLVLMLAFDLFESVVRIQQGRPVHEDGRPAPDGSANLADGVLKADDGVVLDWNWDRDEVEGAPMFARAVADRLRELFLATLFYAAARAGASLPMIWYWPHGVQGVGHISHDTDANLPEPAEAMLAHLQAVGIASTWCVMYPGGYAPGFYPRLLEAGCEIALHYDAKTPGKPTRWGFAELSGQYDWLRAMARVPGVVTNKNHFLRWEGWTELFRWLEALGIQVDQTLGPTKRGNVGFLRGSCHPWFPIDDHAQHNRLIDVLEIGLHTQDLVLTCPYSAASAILREAADRHGVAHFLFHPGHIGKPGVAEALAGAVEHGRALGLSWWTAAQINAWERRRRRVSARGERGERRDEGRVTVKVCDANPDGEAFAGVVRLSAPFAGDGAPDAVVQVDGRAQPAPVVHYCGWPFYEVPLALKGTATIEAAWAIR